jgi:TonB family protein
MPITQIPFQDPVAPPEKPQPEQLDLYASDDWETAYRELDRVPHLLIQLQDDLTRSRRREAVWISVIVHLVLFIMLWNFKLIEDRFWHPVTVVPANARRDRDVTFLTLPPDLQKAPHRPSAVISDKDRTEMSRHPEPNQKNVLITPPAGSRGARGPRQAQPTPPQTMAQAQPQTQQPQQQAPPQSAPRPQFQSNQTSQLQMPTRPNNDFSKYAGEMSAGSAIQQAEQAAAASRSGGGGGGDEGLGRGARGRQMGPLEILSDTQGVDFGPYLQRVVQEVKAHWYELIPQSAEMKRGKLRIQFSILKDGRVADLQLAQSSGDTSLDRPAWGSITGSDPFPPLPTEFGGQSLMLRFTYYYLGNNPDASDLQ